MQVFALVYGYREDDFGEQKQDVMGVYTSYDEAKNAFVRLVDESAWASDWEVEKQEEEEDQREDGKLYDVDASIHIHADSTVAYTLSLYAGDAGTREQAPFYEDSIQNPGMSLTTWVDGVLNSQGFRRTSGLSQHQKLTREDVRYNDFTASVKNLNESGSFSWDSLTDDEKIKAYLDFWEYDNYSIVEFTLDAPASGSL